MMLDPVTAALAIGCAVAVARTALAVDRLVGRPAPRRQPVRPAPLPDLAEQMRQRRRARRAAESADWSDRYRTLERHR